MRKIVFYGDSNTYGYDPRHIFGGEYPDEVIWTNRVAAALAPEWEVVNRGRNGRRIPLPGAEYDYVRSLLDGMSARDVFAVMLGTNDILLTDSPDAGQAAEHMQAFISWLLEQPEHPILLLICPPYIRADGPAPLYAAFHRECVKMNAAFRDIASRAGVRCIDAAEWDVGLSYDCVHFSEEGHRRFAEKLLETGSFD